MTEQKQSSNHKDGACCAVKRGHSTDNSSADIDSFSQSPALGPAFPHSIFSLYPPSMCVLPVVPTAFRYAQPLSSEPPLPSAQGYSHGVGLCSAKASTGWPGPHLSAGISAVPRPAWASSVWESVRTLHTHPSPLQISILTKSKSEIVCAPQFVGFMGCKMFAHNKFRKLVNKSHEGIPQRTLINVIKGGDHGAN